MSNEEMYKICEECPHHMPVIHLDVCNNTQPYQLITSLLAESTCPLGKWNVS